MLFFSHLLSGIITGIILYLFFNDKRVVIFTAIGSILPDLMDKLIGYILLGDTFGNSRTLFHGFWIMIFLLTAGFIILIKMKNPLIFSLSIGVAIHQFEDNMWNYPVNWFWPALGEYSWNQNYEEYFLKIFFEEISSTEEIFCLILLMLGIIVYYLSKKNLI